MFTALRSILSHSTFRGIQYESWDETLIITYLYHSLQLKSFLLWSLDLGETLDPLLSGT